MVDIKNLRLDDWLCIGDHIPVQVGLIMDGRVDTVWDIGLANIFLTDENEAKDKRVLHIKDLSYIELTAEMLESFGLIKRNCGAIDAYEVEGLKGVLFRPSNECGIQTMIFSPDGNPGGCVLCNVQYVSDLQHFIKDLGCDKKIKISGHSINPDKEKEVPEWAK